MTFYLVSLQAQTIPFNGDKWNRLSKDAKQEILQLNKLEQNYMEDLPGKWKKCYRTAQVPEGFLDLYVYFKFKRQLKIMEIQDQYKHCQSADTKSEQEAEKRALESEIDREECLFKGHNKKIMKKILSSPQRQSFFEIKYDVKENDAKEMITFYEQLI